MGRQRGSSHYVWDWLADLTALMPRLIVIRDEEKPESFCEVTGQTYVKQR
jgi:hypothetical protein